MRNQTEKACEANTEIEDKREKVHVSNIPKKANNRLFNLVCITLCIYMCICRYIATKKKAVLSVLEDIKKGVDDLNDSNGLDRVLALLNQAFSSIKAEITPKDTDNLHFEKKDHFYPTQKNETQLKFKKTTTNPGRKRQNVPLRCKFFASVSCYYIQ